MSAGVNSREQRCAPGKLGVVHAADARHEGRKRAHDRDEPREDHGLGAVLAIELLSLGNIFLRMHC